MHAAVGPLPLVHSAVGPHVRAQAVLHARLGNAPSQVLVSGSAHDRPGCMRA